MLCYLLWIVSVSPTPTRIWNVLKIDSYIPYLFGTAINTWLCTSSLDRRLGFPLQLEALNVWAPVWRKNPLFIILSCEYDRVVKDHATWAH